MKTYKLYESASVKVCSLPGFAVASNTNQLTSFLSHFLSYADPDLQNRYRSAAFITFFHLDSFIDYLPFASYV